VIRITHEEAVAFAQPDGLGRREADLFWRAARLARKAAKRGVFPDALVADRAEDLLPGGALLEALGLAGRPAEEILDRARRVRYKLKLHAHEAEIDEPPAVVLLPRDVLPDGLRDALRRGHAPFAAVPFGALRGEVDALRAAGGRVSWTRVRLCPDLGSPGFDLRVRVRGGADSRELRTRLPRAEFPDAAAVTAFVREAVGAGAFLV
jgi:hypothetical protein